VALDAIGADGAAEIMAAVVKAAHGGDMRAADILLRSLWPERKGRPVAFPLPELRTASDMVAALGAVVAGGCYPYRLAVLHLPPSAAWNGGC
jgi:hypothetical protein